MSGYLQTSLDNMPWLWQTANLTVSDLEMLLLHRQLTVMLAEKVRAQDAIRVFSVGTDHNLMFV